MKINVQSIQPDGLTLTFENQFTFNTFQEVFDFVKKVDELYKKSF